MVHSLNCLIGSFTFTFMSFILLLLCFSPCFRPISGKRKARHLAPFPAEALAQAGWTEHETTCQRHAVATLSNHFQSASFSAVEVQLQDRDFSPGPQLSKLYHLSHVARNHRHLFNAKAADSKHTRHRMHSQPHDTPSHLFLYDSRIPL